MGHFMTGSPEKIAPFGPELVVKGGPWVLFDKHTRALQGAMYLEFARFFCGDGYMWPRHTCVASVDVKKNAGPNAAA